MSKEDGCLYYKLLLLCLKHQRKRQIKCKYKSKENAADFKTKLLILNKIESFIIKFQTYPDKDLQKHESN